MQLFFSRKEVNLQKKENKERLSRFITEFFNLYNFTCEDIKLDTQKNKLELYAKVDQAKSNLR